MYTTDTVMSPAAVAFHPKPAQQGFQQFLGNSVRAEMQGGFRNIIR